MGTIAEIYFIDYGTFMNKSIVTNLLALTLTLIGYMLSQSILFSIGLFALSGAFTNWLAVHMLFEKVPGLYGSGIIPARFDDFKAGIRQMIMEQFFTSENIQRFLTSNDSSDSDINFTSVIDDVDLNPAFDGLVDVIEQSSFGGMLAMFGGSEALQPIREPFMIKMKGAIIDITQTEDFKTNIKKLLSDSNVTDGMYEKVNIIIEQRLNELTPELVKDIIQTMIKKHLGWLVVWGGVFGGLFGLIAAII